MTTLYAPGQALQATLKEIAQNDGHGADFIAHTGDLICTSSRPESYEGARLIYQLEGKSPAPGPLTVRAEGLNLPWYYIPGNADDRKACRLRLFPAEHQDYLFNYSWELDGIRFLSLDWGAWKTDSYILEPTAFDWLEKQLKESVPTVILTHHPPVHIGIEKFDKMTPPDLNRLQDLITNSSVIAIFHGHTHYPWKNYIGEVPVYGTGSITYRTGLQEEQNHLEIHSPQYRVVTIQDGQLLSATLYDVPISL
ncbi:MAG: metallophosphoesterase [Acidobacteriia bacterium]|nr:metallophosphoesterase [Terriglobia bacterium]